MNLVAQSPAITPQHAFELAALAGAAGFRELPGGYRFPVAARSTEVEQWCEAREIDFAWRPEGARFSGLGLVAMDMDSTLITIECIDEIGDLAGKKAEIAGITARAMRGEIDYPESLRHRVALLEGLPESALAEVYEKRLRLTPGAEALVAACKRHGIRLLLVSGGFTFFTDRLKARLGIDYTISNRLEIAGGRLTGRVLGDIVDAEAKAAEFRRLCGMLGLAREATVAIGDGANDLKMMAEAGLSVAFHAKPVVRAQASCALTWCGLDGVLNLYE